MDKLVRQIEAILFVAGEPVTTKQLAAACDSNATTVRHVLDHLSRTFVGRGIILIGQKDSWQLVTAPETAEAVAAFQGSQTRLELSKAALETLAIVAYRGPATKADIDTIRGVASDQILRNLLGRGLVIEGGHRDEPGRPLTYVVSHELLAHWGISHTGELPPIGTAS